MTDWNNNKLLKKSELKKGKNCHKSLISHLHFYHGINSTENYGIKETKEHTSVCSNASGRYGWRGAHFIPHQFGEKRNTNDWEACVEDRKKYIWVELHIAFKSFYKFRIANWYKG